MARPCTICAHPQRAAIEVDLATSVPFRVIAERHPGTRATSLQRHKAAHMSDVVKGLVEARRQEKTATRATEAGLVAGSAHDRLERAALKAEAAEAECLTIVRGAPLAGDWSAAAKACQALVAASGEYRQTVVAIGKLTGEIPTGARVVVTIAIGDAEVKASTDEMRAIVLRAQQFFRERHPELVGEFAGYLHGAIEVDRG